MIDTGAGSTPEQLGLVALGPLDRGQRLDPLLDGYGQDVGVERSLGEREHGFESTRDVGSLARGDAVHVDEVRVRAEIGVGAGIGDERLGRSSRNVIIPCSEPQGGTRRAARGPSPNGYVEFLGRVVVYRNQNPSECQLASGRVRVVLTLSVLERVGEIGSVVGTDKANGGVVHTKDCSEIGQPADDAKLFEQVDLTGHSVVSAFDLGFGKGAAGNDLAAFHNEVKGVGVFEGVRDTSIELGGRQGAEESEVGVDLVVLVRKLDVVLPVRRKTWGLAMTEG